ncbi:MAG: acyl-CoA dehydrogenase family protein [Acidobacteriota bacterium]|nr:acyl-CoA dehydrogenase family protein [Acidobacteriota bacterium]
MNVSWSRQQIELKDRIVRSAQESLGRKLSELDQSEKFDREGWNTIAGMGIHGLIVPTRYGGSGADLLSTICALEGLGYGCEDNGLIFSVNAHMWATETALLHFGSESQRQKYLPSLASGTWIGAHAATEPEAGSDFANIQATARRDGDQYRLTGTKLFVTNGPVADVLIVFAKLENKPTAFIVEKGFPGFRVERQMSKMGLRTALMGEIRLDDCPVPAANRIGDEGSGMLVFSQSMEWERAFILASAIGTMERLIERCVQFARSRKQFGQPIGKFQLVSSTIVDMKLRLETSRALLYRVAALKQQGRSLFLEASATKLYLSESWVQSCLDAMQIHGGYGYLTETGLERQLRDALASRVFSGTSEMQRVIIAEMMGL